MLTAVLILILVSFKDEISGLIDLYSTLQGNLTVYALNTFLTGTLGSIEFYFDFWIIDKIDKDFTTYMLLMLIVNLVGTIFGVFIIHNKKKIKNMIRKKKISKSMKEYHQKKKEEGNELKTGQATVQEVPKDIPSEKSSNDSDGNVLGV